MSRKIIFVGLLIAVSSLFAAVSAQNVKPSAVSGEVVATNGSQIKLKTANGDISVVLSANTEYKRVSAQKPSLSTAVAATLADISVGDKLLVTGIFGDDKTTLPAKAVYIMSQSDIAQKQKIESERWIKRGISGKVSVVDAVAKTITIEVKGLTTSTSVVVTPSENAKFMRYAPNSVKYSEALPSSLVALKAGDMLRAVGDKSADGKAFAAEEVLSGSFQTIAGAVKSIDLENNKIVISDLLTKEDFTVSLASASVFKRFPAEMASRMAAAQMGTAGQGGQGRPAGAPAGQTAQGGTPQAGNGSTGGIGQRAGNIDEMLQLFPNITVADIKVGEIIAVSSTKGGDSRQISAIKLLAGVEPFIRIAQMAGAGRGGRGGGGMGTFSIPGLDGIDVP